MSNGNTIERLFNLQAKINMMVMDGKRSPEEVADALQAVLEQSASPRVLAGLLKEVGEPVKCPAKKRFVARKKFVVGVDGELPISGMGQNFINNFLDLVEENVPAMTLRERELLKRSLDKPILEAHGDTLKKIERARVYLAQVFHFLKTADRSNGFIFYIADAKGTVWAAHARWRGGGWSVGAGSVRGPGEWLGGRRVVSPQILRNFKK